MTGTTSQIEWAERIKPRVAAEFDRIELAFQAVAARQEPAAKRTTESVIEILKEKRAEVMAKDAAGYFIKDWQELTDQVRKLIAADARYKQLPVRRGKHS
jgi:uncharacterized protein (UPF0216 family)